MAIKIHSDVDLIDGLDIAGKHIILQGQSGSGKSFFSQELVKCHYQGYKQIKLIGYPTSQTAYSCLYQGIAGFIKKDYLDQEKLWLLLKKYTKLLPQFGKHISAILDVDKVAAYRSYISKTGLSFGTSPSVHVYDLLCDIYETDKFVLVFEDAQWIDNSSWELIDYLSTDLEAAFPVIIVLNNKTESWVSNYDARLAALDKLQKDARLWFTVEISKWPESKTHKLLTTILQKDLKIANNYLNNIYSKSEGLPLFVESILISLLSSNLLIEDGVKYTAKGDWGKIELQPDLKKQIMKRLQRVYGNVQNSQALLEVASVLGDPFDFNQVDKVASYHNSQEVFLNVAKRFKLIEYLFMDRKWTFDHYQTRVCIYESLGGLAREIHVKIAMTLIETEGWRDYLRISYHFAQANLTQEAVEYKLKEVEYLLSIGLFEQALDLTDEVEQDLEEEFFLKDLQEKRKLLKGQSLFNVSRYSEAITTLDSALVQTSDKYIQAMCLRWKGKTLAKLDTDKDFQVATECLLESIKILENDTENQAITGAIYSDLVVGYAHRNKFKEAYSMYQKAEEILNRANDRLGLAKLQRRCMIFMEPELAGPILVKLEKFFKNIDVHHERIMSLVNASTQYIGMSQFDQALELLIHAQSISLDYADFGNSYIYNNLGIVHLIKGEFKEAHRALEEARNSRYRAVERLIIDINEAVLFLLRDGHQSALIQLKKVYELAKKTSEKAYMIPARLNYILGLIKAGKYELAQRLLESTELLDSDIYTTAKYHKAKYYGLWQQLGQKVLLKDYDFYQSQHENTIGKLGKGIYNENEITLIRFQFWSD